MPVLTEEGDLVARRVVEARSFGRRLAGWIGRDVADPDEALYLPRCPSVHTLFMKMPIDVVFLDRAGRILRICEGLPPWRVASCVGASGVVELAAGRSRAAGLSAGRRLVVLDPEAA